MPPSPTQAIPAFYRIFFTSIDPLIALTGAYLSYFDPNTVITSLFPASNKWAHVTPSHMMLFHQAGGAFVMMAFYMIFMLRATNDVRVWKLFEFGVLITDGTLFYSHWAGLEAQGRLGVGKVRWEEWSTFAITGFVTVMRVSFVVGVGLGGGKTVQQKKRQ